MVSPGPLWPPGPFNLPVLVYHACEEPQHQGSANLLVRDLLMALASLDVDVTALQALQDPPPRRPVGAGLPAGAHLGRC